jgi:hypothetical protein
LDFRGLTRWSFNPDEKEENEMRNTNNRHDVVISGRAERERRGLVTKLRKAIVPVVEDLRNVAKRRLTHCFPNRRAEALRIVRETEKICALLAATEVKIDSLLIRLEEREL